MAVLEKNRGNVAEAIEHLKRAAPKNGHGRVDFLLACCYAQNGESDTALEHLRKAIEEDQSNRILARHDRDFDPVRETPGFPGAAGLVGAGRPPRILRSWARRAGRRGRCGHPTLPA